MNLEFYSYDSASDSDINNLTSDSESDSDYESDEDDEFNLKIFEFFLLFYKVKYEL